MKLQHVGFHAYNTGILKRQGTKHKSILDFRLNLFQHATASHTQDFWCPRRNLREPKIKKTHHTCTSSLQKQHALHNQLFPSITNKILQYATKFYCNSCYCCLQNITSKLLPLNRNISYFYSICNMPQFHTTKLTLLIITY